MSVVRYECPRCQSVFVPVEAVTAGAYARCPTCTGLAVPAPGVADESTMPLRPAPPPDAGLGAVPATVLDRPDPSGETRPAAPLFQSLLEGREAPPPAPAPSPAPGEPAADPDAVMGAVQPPGGGLFSSLLATAADLELSGRRAPIVDRSPEGGVTLDMTRPVPPPPADDAPIDMDARALPPGGAIPRNISMSIPLPPPSALDSSEVTLPAALVPAPVSTPGLPVLAPAPPAPAPAPQPWDIANTGMVLGPADGGSTGENRIPQGAAQVLAGLPAPPTGMYLDQQTFSDREFEAMLGGSFAPSHAEPTDEHVLPDSWVVSNPGGPPPLKRAKDSPPGPPAPPLRPKPAAPTGASLVAGLAPIPSVASLGKPPRLKDGISLVRVAALVVSAVLVGGLAGAALAPPPAKPPTAGPDGALHKLAQARRFMASGRNEEAVAVLQAALALDGRLAEAQRDLGVALARLERWEEAARAYEGYLEMAPRAPDAYQVDQTLRLYRAKAEPK